MTCKILLSFCLGLLICSCQAPVYTPFTLQDYSQNDPLFLPVSNIQVIDQTDEFPSLPHIENQLPISPAQALETALSNHFKPTRASSSDTLTITILEAAIIQKKQPNERWYIFDNVEYFLSYRLKLSYTHQNQSKSQEITGWEKQSIPQKSTLIEKEKTWQKMLNHMLEQVISKIETDILF